MVDLSGGNSGGPIEHGFNNYIFLFAGLLVFSVVDQETLDSINVEHYEGLEDLAGDDEKLQEILNKIMEGAKATAKSTSPHALSIHWSVYILAFSIIFGVLGLFSYKLVQSLKEKERKREEKKKLKEMKKKK